MHYNIKKPSGTQTSVMTEIKEGEVLGAQDDRKSFSKSSPQGQVSLGQVERRRENAPELSSRW